MVKAKTKIKKERPIQIIEGTLWTKIDMAVLAFFAKYRNKPATYREISRAYVSSSYSNYQKACEKLTKTGWLIKTKEGSFKVTESRWPQVKENKLIIEREFPYMQTFLKKLKN